MDLHQEIRDSLSAAGAAIEKLGKLPPSFTGVGYEKERDEVTHVVLIHLTDCVANIARAIGVSNAVEGGSTPHVETKTEFPADEHSG